MKYDALGTRMKKYEYVTRNYLVSRMPVIIRLDGKSFHTFTRGFKKPFDDVLVATMQDTMKYLCENIQGCVFGYTQSDEITLVLVDYKKLDSCSWFDNNIQKCASISASMATMAFNKFFNINLQILEGHPCYEPTDEEAEYTADFMRRLPIYQKVLEKGAIFDSRVFNIPKEEVTNCILWRQNDATRNSIQMVGQANFSQRELHGKSCNKIQDMLFIEKGINWNDYPAYLKRGTACIKVNDTTKTNRPHWFVDRDMPILSGDGRKYVDDLIFIGE